MWSAVVVEKLVTRSQAVLEEAGQLVEGDEVRRGRRGRRDQRRASDQFLGLGGERLYASSLNSREWAWSPVMNSIGRGEIVSMSLNG